MNVYKQFYKIIIPLFFVCLVSEKTFSETYYIDATNGNDTWNGTAKSTAWKTLTKVNAITFMPKDSLLFKCGNTWDGQFTAKGSGNAQYPIVVSNYGTGNKPIIDGKGVVKYGILLEDVSYWHIENMEITNNSLNEGDRIGVLLKANAGQLKHFRLTNLYIHDIKGKYTFELAGKNTGGIGIIGNGTSMFDDILIEKCEIGNVVRVGIFTNGNTGTRGNRPITNLIIRNNKIHHCAGDGAIIRYAKSPLIEHNIVYENHNVDEKLVSYGVALWCRSTDEAVFQYNEVYKTRGSLDGQAFDSDLDTYRTLVQYNYTHDNEGGFMLVYCTSSDAIVRYNISVNDGTIGLHLINFPSWINPRGTGVFHNNVFYIPSGNNAVVVDEALDNSYFYNNIFYKLGGGSLSILSNGKTAVFDNNAMFGYSPIDRSIDAKVIAADPLLINPGLEGNGFAYANGYKIGKNSPCYNKGIDIKQMQNYWLPNLGNVDFWGTPLSGINSVGVY